MVVQRIFFLQGITTMKALHVFILLVLLFSTNSHADMLPYPAPDWQLNTIEGKAVSLQQFRGQPVVLLFWATWCPYCKKLMPGLQRLQQKYADKGLQVVMIDYNEDEGADVVGTLAARGITLLNVIGGDAVAEHYNVGAVPTTFFIDRKGRVVGRSNKHDPNAPEFEHYAQWLSK
jgi:thiol-disulfide isomerase/thioredoxin